MLDIYYSNSDTAIQYEHNRTNNYAADFHLHNRFEIYFFITGSVNYFIEKNIYPLKYGDLFVMNSHEIHKPSFLNNQTYERITLHFDPAIPQLFNTGSFNLLNCFLNRPIGEQNKINLSPEQINDVLRIFQKLESLKNGSSESLKILKLSYFIELLVFLNNAFMNSHLMEDHSNIPEKLIPILDYINKNLEGDLSLEFLEKRFYINGSYLSRLFKKSTGSTIHEYIIYKRISKAKKLLAEGFSATESAFMCGFNDFSNFSRLFKRTVGVSLRQYKTEAKNSFSPIVNTTWFDQPT